jgi:hypothetical protein
MNGNFLEARFSLSFVGCAERSGELALEPVLPLAPNEYKSKQGELIRIEYRSPDFLMGDANFTNAATAALENKITQTVSLRVELGKILTPEQRRSLAQGKPVRARLGLLARRIATLLNKGARTPLGQRFLGSFTFFVTISP